MRQALVSGMLIDQDQAAIGGNGHDVCIGDLAERGA
jgi:hypothetical protein